MENNKKIQLALQMIAAGQEIESVMNITGFTPEQMHIILTEVKKQVDEMNKIEIRTTMVVEEFTSSSLGKFVMNLN